MAWVRILLLFECFGGVPPKAFEAGDSSFRALESWCCSAVLEGACPMALQRKASWQCLLLTLFFCDLDGALPFWPVCFFLGRGRASNAKKHPGSACFWRHFSAILMGLCRFDPCVFSLAVAVPATRNRFVRFAIFSFSLGLPSATKSILAVPASDAIFLRFRWGSVVLGVLEGASSNGFVFSLMDSKGNVRHFFGVVFAWHGLESCCCSAVLEGASSRLLCIFFNGFQR